MVLVLGLIGVYVAWKGFIFVKRLARQKNLVTNEIITGNSDTVGPKVCAWRI